ncbi:hypothetical protein D3C87_1942450 [compost metagenome]
MAGLPDLKAETSGEVRTYQAATRDKKDWWQVTNFVRLPYVPAGNPPDRALAFIQSNGAKPWKNADLAEPT